MAGGETFDFESLMFLADISTRVFDDPSLIDSAARETRKNRFLDLGCALILNCYIPKRKRVIVGRKKVAKKPSGEAVFTHGEEIRVVEEDEESRKLKKQKTHEVDLEWCLGRTASPICSSKIPGPAYFAAAVTSNVEDTKDTETRIVIPLYGGEQGMNMKQKKQKTKKLRKSEGSEGGESKAQRKNPKKVNFDELGLSVPPDMPADLRKYIESKGGSNFKLVIMKQLFATDLSAHHKRLSFPKNQLIERDFLSPEEDERIAAKEGLEVRLIQPRSLDEAPMRLTEWSMNKSSSYNLVSGWKTVIENMESNGLKLNDIIQLWSFRLDGDLWFALVNVVRHGENSRTGDADGASSSRTCNVEVASSSRTNDNTDGQSSRMGKNIEADSSGRGNTDSAGSTVDNSNDVTLVCNTDAANRSSQTEQEECSSPSSEITLQELNKGSQKDEHFCCCCCCC